MFNFLNSAVLIAAAAALIPLLIHLFSKRKVKIIEFSSLKHLKEMQRRQVRRIKLRQLLLLLLRMLIILAAVLAFARPASKGGFIGSHAGVSSVILLDRSASMQRQVKDGILFDLAKKSVGHILESFGQSDELLLIPYDRQVYFPAGERFFSREVAENVLKELTPGYGEDDFQEAFNKAVKLLSGAKNLNKELYIVTDRQLNSLPEKADSLDENASVYFVDLPVETDGNCGVVNIETGGQLIEVGSPFTIKAQIKNYDNFSKSELLASLFVDGIRVMQTEFAVGGNETETVPFRHTVYKPGYHSGWVEISDDGLPPDNKFYFSFKIPEQFNVLTIDGDNSGQLIQLALVPSEQLARYWSVKTVTPDMLTSVRLRDYDVVVAAGISNLPSTVTSQLFSYVDRGGGLFFVMGSDIDKDYFNNNFGSKLDITIDEPPPDNVSGAGYYTLERFDYSHPIFKAFDVFQKDSLPTLKFFALAKIKDGTGNRDLAWFSNGSPALIEQNFGLGKIILLSSPILTKYTDLASHSFFVPFVIRTLEYLAHDMSTYELNNYIGGSVFRTISGEEAGYSTIQMMTPDNRQYGIAGVEKNRQLTFECRPIDMPGIYSLKNDNKLIDLFPVNLPAKESDLTTVDFDRQKTSLGIQKSKILPYEQSFAASISEARFGRELWKIFLWAAAVLLAVEMLFARDSAKQTEEQ